MTFQLTPSRRATSMSGMMTRAMIFQLSPSRRATPFYVVTNKSEYISTHALTEGDRPLAGKQLFFDISTHALTEGD